MHDKIFRYKKTFVAMMVGLALMLPMLILLKDPTSVNFASDASEDVDSVRIVQTSKEAQQASNLPECVKSLTYIPETASDTSCIVNIRCLENITDAEGSMCVISHEKARCDVQSPCLTLDDWKKEASKICGC